MSINGRFIITGGVGCGKSSTLLELGLLGFTIFEEAARNLIRDPYIISKKLLPWNNRALFDKYLIERMLIDYANAEVDQISFFDRGLPDLIGWAEHSNLNVSKYLDIICKHPYNNNVFFLRPDKNYYEKDLERPFSFRESVLIGEYVRKGYVKLNYNIVDVPVYSPTQMAKHIALLARQFIK